jgi:hypothetical protein
MQKIQFSIRICPLIVFSGGLIFSSYASALTRHEELICRFSSGSHVNLQATYDWSVAGSLLKNIGHVSSRKNQSGYYAFFSLSEGKYSRAPGGAPYTNPLLGNGSLDERSGRQICAAVGLLNGRPLVSGSFLQDNGIWFTNNLSGLRLGFSFDTMPKWVSKHLRRIHGSPTSSNFSFVAPIDGTLINEQPIHDSKAGFVVRAVYQSISQDGGKTWSKPIITPYARIFEIGRELEDQSFVARPISFEGKDFKIPKFTKNQTVLERANSIGELPPQWQQVISE